MTGRLRPAWRSWISGEVWEGGKHWMRAARSGREFGTASDSKARRLLRRAQDAVVLADPLTVRRDGLVLVTAREAHVVLDARLHDRLTSRAASIAVLDPEDPVTPVAVLIGGRPRSIIAQAVPPTTAPWGVTIRRGGPLHVVDCTTCFTSNLLTRCGRVTDTWRWDLATTGGMTLCAQCLGDAMKHEAHQ